MQQPDGCCICFYVVFIHCVRTHNLIYVKKAAIFRKNSAQTIVEYSRRFYLCIVKKILKGIRI